MRFKTKKTPALAGVFLYIYLGKCSIKIETYRLDFAFDFE
ncbi:hypothetical protein C4J85_2958 [Pseudomonas sp. R4-34-07]|nr:hypothetical protein C4J85_2958 [Pseudomonas sp. R4-34-07]